MIFMISSLSSLSSLCSQVLLDSAPRVGQELEEVSFSFFCDKMARMFVPHFQEHLYRLRKCVPARESSLKMQSCMPGSVPM